MEPGDLLDHLLALVREAGIAVRLEAGAAPGELPVRSGLCRLRGESLLVLVAADPIAERIEVTAQALRSLAPELVAGRFLPPAVREALEGAIPDSA